MDGCTDDSAAPGTSSSQILLEDILGEDGSGAAEQQPPPAIAAALPECNPPSPLALDETPSLTPVDVPVVFHRGPCIDHAAVAPESCRPLPDGDPPSRVLTARCAAAIADHQEPQPLRTAVLETGTDVPDGGVVATNAAAGTLPWAAHARLPGVSSPDTAKFGPDVLCAGGAAAHINPRGLAQETCAKDNIILQSSNPKGLSEFQEQLLHSLTGITHKHPGEPHLPADFRLQLQLLECSLQQRKLMQRMTYQQQHASAQLDTICTQGLRQQSFVEEQLAALQQRLDRLTAQVELKLPRDQTKAAAPVEEVESLTKMQAQGHIAKHSANATTRSLAAEMISTIEDRQTLVAELAPKDIGPQCMSSRVEEGENVLGSPTQSSASPTQSRSVAKHFKLAEAPSASRKRPRKEHSKRLVWLRKMISSVYFDALCGVVIICNAVAIGVHTQEAVDYAILHVGEPEKAPREMVKKAGYFFCAFYTAELLLKLAVFRCGFFQGDLWKWNVFDMLLVVLGLYDLILEELASVQGGGLDVMWVRLLRFLKTLKMLRMVRVMRFFRVLRMMVSSIAGSMMTLVWSILMLSLMMYIFSICFLQSIIGYLSETSERNLAPDVNEAIVTYWSSVHQCMVTLYIAVTGGSDWEPLAKPLLEAGYISYGLFLFYIAFTAFAVLNVMTGLYCDTASKISEMDDENVKVEQTDKLREFFHRHSFWGSPNQDSSDREAGDVRQLTWDTFEDHIASRTVQKFLRAVDIKEEDARHIFDILDRSGQGAIELEDFVASCICYNRGATCFDMVCLNAESKAYMEAFTRHVEDVKANHFAPGGVRHACTPSAGAGVCSAEARA